MTRGAAGKHHIAVIGAGYVGLVAGACFAHLGIKTEVINRSSGKVKSLKRGVVPFYEPGLGDIIKQATKKKLLTFSTDLKKAVVDADIIMIAVGTPSMASGKVDMADYWAVLRTIAKELRGYACIVNKSTVPVGTAEKARKLVASLTKQPFDIVSFPEFLREGTAVKDFMEPDRLIVGTDSPKAKKILSDILSRIQTKKLFTSIETAEMIKYASNAFLATKISFINEIANICESVGADVDEVAKGMGLDKRIGESFLKAGIGYGGSCFPKDVKALNHIAGSHKYSFKLLKAVIEVNANQRRVVVTKLERLLKSLHGKTVAVLGLAFKGNTDDVRESAAIDIIQKLVAKGVHVAAHDPIAESNAKRVLGAHPMIMYHDTLKNALKGSHAVIIATEWDHFKTADWKNLKSLMLRPLIVDGRNHLSKQKMLSLGFEYHAVGK